MVYILVNPLSSSTPIESKKKNNNDAAEDIWNQFSTNIKNYTPTFYFTIQEGGTSKLSHYIIKESIENDKVKYKLNEFKDKNINTKEFLNELKQIGGRKYDDSSSSSSSSSERLVFTFPHRKDDKSLKKVNYFTTLYGVPNLMLPTLSQAYAPFGWNVILYS